MYNREVTEDLIKLIKLIKDYVFVSGRWKYFVRLTAGSFQRPFLPSDSNGVCAGSGLTLVWVLISVLS